jgi:uncharacterized membrane protein YfcA
MKMRYAVAAGSAVGLAIAIAGAIGFTLGDPMIEGHHPELLGMVCGTAAIAIALPAVAFAPIGVALSHSIETKKLKRSFGFVMLLASVITVWKVVN